MKRKTLYPSLALIGFMVALLFCSRDYNPYADLTNARVHVLSWSFKDSASVPLYSTGVMKLVVALHEEVDSFVIRAPGNRYWEDMTIRAGMGGLSGGPWSFSVSFFDTGLQKITVETHRSNGEVLPQILEVRVTNGLGQEDIAASFGKPFRLATAPVADKDVFYHWDFGPGRKDSSLASSFVKTFYYFAPSRDTGHLWVTDLSGKNASPKFPFSYSFIDTAKPVITGRTSGVIRGDTLLTGDTTLVFRVQIVDSGVDQVDFCSINGMPFETENYRERLYTKIINNLPFVTRTGPLALTVFARDNPDFPNVATRTFWVRFEPGAATNALAEIVVLVPAAAQPVAGRRDYKMYGEVKSYFTEPQALTMTMWVNGAPMPDPKVFAQGSGAWVWPVYLDQPVNTVLLKLENAVGDSLTAVSKTIVYDPNAKDTVLPLLFEISDSADGRRLYSNSGDKNIVLFTAKPSMTLKVVAFDEGSGIRDVALNNMPIQPAKESEYVWYGKVSNIVHNPQGVMCNVRVTDNAANTNDLTLTFIKNKPPVLISSPEVPPVLFIDSTYQFRLLYSDEDNDPVTILWRSKPGSMDTVRNGIIIWRPTVNDIGSDSIIIQGSDGYSYSERFIRAFDVIERRLPQRPVRFTVSADDFPPLLQAGRDTLLVWLTTDTVVPGLRYSAIFTDRAQTINLSTSSPLLTWQPLPADTGYRRLRLTVGSADTAMDTILAAFRVVPRNENPCRLSYTFTGNVTADGALDLYSHPAAETLYFAIQDSDHPLTEEHTVSITRNGVKSVQMADNKKFSISIEPDSLKTGPPDTIDIRVSDRTGTADSVRFILHFVAPAVNNKPYLASGPLFPAWLFADSGYRFAVIPFDADNDSVEVVVLHKPAGMAVSAEGVIVWTPSAADTGVDSLVVRFYDGRDYSDDDYRWPLTVVDVSSLPPPVRLGLSGADFPAVLQAGDSIVLPLTAAPGTGAPPFVYAVRLVDNGVSLIPRGSDSLLFWKTSMADTGMRALMVSVADYYGRKDSLVVVVKVVPPNQYPCSLAYGYSGTTVAPGVLMIRYPGQPEKITFTISDFDNPAAERFTVDIVKDRIRSTQTLSGETRSFTLTISPSPVSTVDTLLVRVGDLSGASDSVTVIINYLGLYLRQIKINTTAAGAGVATSQINFPVLVRLNQSNFDFSKARSDGLNIVFRKADGTIFPHEIEQWDSAGKIAAVWVRVDTVFGNDSTRAVSLSCGEGQFPSNSGAVFDTANGFCGVWHLNENPAAGAASIKDRTSFGWNGTPYNLTAASSVAGAIGNALNFPGNANVSFGDINQVDGVTRLTASAWIRPGVLTDAAMVIGKLGNIGYQWGFFENNGMFGNNDFLVTARNNGGTGDMDGSTSGNVISSGNWYHCVMVYDGTQPNNAQRLKFYLNGTQLSLSFRGAIPAQLPSTNAPVVLAFNWIDNAYFRGIIDEAAVARSARSADWIRLCYMNQKSIDALLTVR